MGIVKLYLDKRRVRDDGKYPLKLSVTSKGKYCLINLDIHILETELILKKDGYIISGPKNSSLLNRIVSSKRLQVENRLYNLEMTGRIRTMTNSQFKEAIIAEEEETTTEVALFKDMFEQFVSSKDNDRTKEIYKSTYSRISHFCDIETLNISNINNSWLNSFDTFLKGLSLKTNARSIHLRNIRAIFNYAIDNEFISISDYPFRRFKIKSEKTIKRALSVENLVKLRDYPCEAHQERYRDIFMLIFYLIGINIKDLLNLKEIVNGRVEYRRAKTGRLYSIEVLPQAMMIIDKYKGKEHLLSIIEGYSDYRTFTGKINKHLQEIGGTKIQKKVGGKKYTEIVNPLFPNLTTYWARHTWATIAAKLDIPKETIAAALGHGGNTVTDIYIDYDQKKVDEANQKIVNYIETFNL